jgi:hypothetical protein
MGGLKLQSQNKKGLNNLIADLICGGTQKRKPKYGRRVCGS